MIHIFHNQVTKEGITISSPGGLATPYKIFIKLENKMFSVNMKNFMSNSSNKELARIRSAAANGTRDEQS